MEPRTASRRRSGCGTSRPHERLNDESAGEGVQREEGGELENDFAGTMETQEKFGGVLNGAALDFNGGADASEDRGQQSADEGVTDEDRAIALDRAAPGNGVAGCA